ncbi:hypothetical protein LTR35_018004 [Friedmanniomyces endolithicus]|nr:hypothetical protein LTS09_017655 [Friedmanniomyces endolithicus]KAK0260429.1 hypothetical protein LTR35_018004 [Friedmanniomyces endolithicus]KAK0267118.1 hypothetical protein LTS00_017868 [Friedmanniomyces endolithicus]KAK0302763.1 hypothetical protein LTR01_008530 [Friedmanniomyces endolithicus]KAK0823307.1 hypothetical protein LTR73_008622 [Friedmanniomyces endolithicus]
MRSGLIRSPLTSDRKHELLRDEVWVVCDRGGDSETIRVQQRNRARSGVSASVTLPANSRSSAPLPAPASPLSDTTTRNHWRQTHQWSASDHRGNLERIEAEEYSRRCADASSSVCCQRLFPTGQSFGYFEVLLGDAETSRAGADAKRESAMKLASIFREELAALEEEQDEGGHVFRGFESAKEVSLGSSSTRWPEDLKGQRLGDVAKFGAPASSESEPALSTLCDSLERLVKEVHQSACNDSATCSIKRGLTAACSVRAQRTGL